MVEDKRAFLRGIASSMQQAQERPLDASLLLAFGLFIVVVVTVFLAVQNRSRLRRYWIRLQKRMQGALVPTNRFRIHCHVTLEIPGYDGDLMTTTTTNLSANGMFIKINPPLIMGEKVRFHLDLEGETTISGEFEVRWVQDGWSEHHPTGVGVKFLGLSETKTNQIKLWLQRRNPKRAT